MAQIVLTSPFSFCAAAASSHGVGGASGFCPDMPARGVVDGLFAGGNWLVTNGGARSRGQSIAAVIRILLRVIGTRSSKQDHRSARKNCSDASTGSSRRELSTAVPREA